MDDSGLYLEMALGDNGGAFITTDSMSSALLSVAELFRAERGTYPAETLALILESMSDMIRAYALELENGLN